MTRGHRNNNPLNIRMSSEKWRGKIGNDGQFEKFIDMIHGLRAGMVNLRTYFYKHKLNTVRQIINRWAPPVENNTELYVRYVAGAMRVEPDAKLTFEADTIASMVKAMAKMESDYIPTDADLRAAWMSI